MVAINHQHFQQQVTVGALLTVPGNGKEYSAVATVFAGALQAVLCTDVSFTYIVDMNIHKMAMYIVNNMSLLPLLLLLSLNY